VSEEADLTPAQCRAARAMLNISAIDLAKATGVGLGDIQEFEGVERVLGEAAIMELKTYFHAAGITLIASGSQSVAGGEGIRLGPPASKSVDVIESEVVQYPEFMHNDAPPGAGG
jgi:hypothetical protein